MNINERLKNELVVNAIWIILIFLVFIGFSIAFFVDTKEGDDNVITFGDIGMEFSVVGSTTQSYENNISVNGTNIPISTEEALETEPYVFTVRNTGTLPLTITILLESTILSNYSSTTPNELEENIYVALQEVGVGSPVISKLSDLTDGILGVTNLMEQQSKTYNVWTWVREDAPNSVQGTQLITNIKVRGEYTPYSTIEGASNTTITLDKQGGIGGSNSVAVSYGMQMPHAEAPTKDGYTFWGYYSEPNGKGSQYYDSSMNGVRPSNLTSNKTLYAFWTTQFAQDSWATIVANVNAGNTSKYHVGDTKEVTLGNNLGKHTLRIANKTMTSDCVDSNTTYSQTACGFVLEFADIIVDYAMRTDADTNVGGWPALTAEVGGMRYYVNNTIYNALPTDLKNGIINTRVISGHGSTQGETNFTSTDKLYLFSLEEINGDFSGDYIASTLTTSETRQLDYYNLIEVTRTSYQGAVKEKDGKNTFAYYLRSPSKSNNTSFKALSTYGINDNSAMNFKGVSPAFRLNSGSLETHSWETIVANVASKNADIYYIGETKTVTLDNNLGTHTLRLANKTTTSDCSNTSYSQAACGFVLEFADIITNRAVNSTDTNLGSWPETEIRNYVNSTIYNSLPAALRNGIEDTRIISGHGSTDTSNFTSIDKLYFLSRVELYGSNYSSDSVTLSESRQLDYYRDIGTDNSNYSGTIKKLNGTVSTWWQLSPMTTNDTSFRNTATEGNTAVTPATTASGISPAFRLAGSNSFRTDSWETIIAKVKSNNVEKYKVGDTKEIDMGPFGTHTLRIANKTTTSDCSNTAYSQTACGFVLEFADIIMNHSMNSTDTNLGGWPATELREYLNSTIYESIPTVIKNAIIDTRVISGYGANDTSNFTSTDKLYLLTRVEKYGANVAGDTLKITGTRQLDYYQIIGVGDTYYSGARKKLNGTYSSWWERTAYATDTASFRSTRADGGVGTAGVVVASTLVGVSPAFRIG